MSRDARVRATPNGFDLDGRTVPLLSGEVHYFRHDPADWPRILDEVAALGLTMVSTYVPWEEHELEAGLHDFGDKHRARDLRHFLDLAHERSLLVAIRPGPHINAELTWLGFPPRVLRDPDVMARTPAGNPVWLPLFPRPIPIPSYASPRFLDEVDRWLAAVARQVGDLRWPEGPIVTVQLDNEAPLLFRDGPFDQDYSEPALAAYEAFLRDRGRKVAAPPRSFEAPSVEDLRPILDWLDFKVLLYASAMRRMRTTLEGAGLDQVLFTHNMTQGGAVPAAPPGAWDAADIVGCDFYQQRHLLPFVRGRCLYAAGTCLLPYAAELGTGGPWNLPPIAAEDTETLARATMAYGLRGMNLYMAADRDRWYGAPIGIEGERQELAYRAARETIETFRSCRVNELRLRARVAIIVPRLYAQLSQATWALSPFFPPSAEAFGIGPDLGCREDSFGLTEPPQIAWTRTVDRLTRALSRSGIGHVLVDSDALPTLPEGISHAIVPTQELFDRGLWETLGGLVEVGIELLIGATLPRVDVAGVAYDLPEVGVTGLIPLEGGCTATLAPIADESGAAELAAGLVAREGLAGPVRPGVDDLDVTVLDDEGELALVAVVELSGRRRPAARIVIDDGLPPLVDVQSGGRLVVGQGVAKVALEAFGVRLFRPGAP